MAQNKIFTPEDLKAFNGQDGQPAYIAFKGAVYDVTDSKLWRTGKHMNRHFAGRDMTEEFKEAPHKADVLEKFQQVGTFKAPEPEEPLPERKVPAIVHRFPFLKRHPHPMTVHFPIGFTVGSTVLVVLHLLTGWKGFDPAVLCLLGLSVAFTPVAVLTGLYTWWLNYYSRKTLSTDVKLVLAPLLFVLQVAALVWRLVDPTALTGGGSGFSLLVLAQFPVVVVVGWFGANLTFPIHEE